MSRTRRHLFVLIFFLIAYLGLGISHARGADLRVVQANKYESLFVTLNPALKSLYLGPIYQDGQEERYLRELFSIILEEAHVKGLEYLRSGNMQAYYAFMIGALIVPEHESGLVHFRQIRNLRNTQGHSVIRSGEQFFNGTVCNDTRNSGSTKFVSGEKTKNLIAHNFNRYMKGISSDKNEKLPNLVPNCRHFVENELLDVPATRLIGSTDYLSYGLFQFTLNWWYREYFAKSDRPWLDVRKTIRLGISTYFKGFDALVNNAGDHSKGMYQCLFRSPQHYHKITNLGDVGFEYKKGHLNYLHLLIGAWSGKFNSGNTKNSCRFVDQDNPWHGNDLKFMPKLRNILHKNDRSFWARFLINNKSGNAEIKRALNYLIDMFLHNKSTEAPVAFNKLAKARIVEAKVIDPESDHQIHYETLSDGNHLSFNVNYAVKPVRWFKGRYNHPDGLPAVLRDGYGTKGSNILFPRGLKNNQEFYIDEIQYFSGENENRRNYWFRIWFDPDGAGPQSGQWVHVGNGRYITVEQELETRPGSHQTNYIPILSEDNR